MKKVGKMVRFVNQNFAMNFNFQSENNNTGLTSGGGGDKEFIDQDLAKKAVQAVLSQRGMHLDNGYQTESGSESSCYTSESESMESEASEGEHSENKDKRLIIDEDGQSDIKQVLINFINTILICYFILGEHLIFEVFQNPALQLVYI